MSQGMDKDRRGQDLDLDKDAVKDLTPKTETMVQDPIDPAPAQPHRVDPESPKAAQPAEKPSSGLPVVAGAVAGAVFGLLGTIVYQNVQKPPVTVADPRVAQVEAAIAAVDRKTIEASAIEQRLLGQIKAIDGKMSALDARATALADQAAVLDKRSGVLDQKTVAAEQKAAAAEQRATAVESRAATLIVPVDDRLKAAETRLGEAREQALTLAKRVDLLAQIEAPKVDLRPIVAKVEELERAVGSNSARVTLSGETTLAIDGRVKAVEQTVKGVEGATKAAEASIKGLESAIGDVRTRRPVETAGAVLAISGMARRSLEQGEGIGHLSTALSALGVAPPALAPLAAYAQTPAPSGAALAALYDDLARKIIKPAPAAPAPAAGGSIVDRVTSGLWSQVEVKPVGKNASIDATGIGGQVRARLVAGDLAGANGLVATLPAEQQAALKAFTDAVNARIAALNALRAIETDALAVAARKG